MDPIRAFLDRSQADAADFGPIPAWWWSGETLEIGRMRWQMDQLRAMGIRQFVVINLAPNGTMFCSDADDPPYMSEAWWAIFGQVCDHAKSIGMKVWFYDQIGFSGASYQADIATAHPSAIAQQLRRQSLQGMGTLTVTCPDAGEPLAAYALDSNGRTRSVEIAKRSATITVDTAETLHLVYTVRQGYDLFSLIACEHLLDAVHRQFEERLPEYLGTTIVGSFQDELPDLPSWGPTFADTFAKRFGYRLESRIHHLFEEGDAAARRTRVHYHMHRAALAEEAFFKPFFAWHESHGLKCGFDQQSPAREARVIGAIEKYADYMQTHKWYACPGSDLHGNGKLHASLAFLHQRPRVWLEGFHSTGWGGTIADTFDWMLPYLQQGVTLYNCHAVYYGTSKGWWEWAPPSTCWRQPYAMHYPHFAQMIERLLSVLSRGVQQVSVAVLFPTATVQANVGVGAVFDGAKYSDTVLHETMGSVRWHQVKTGALDSIALDYLVLDEPAIADSIGDGAIIIHGVAMTTLILPAVTILYASTIERLIRFVQTGGRLIRIGSGVIERVEGDAIDFGALSSVTIIASADALPATLATADRSVSSDLPTLYRKDGDVHLLFVPASHGMATVVKWDSWFAPLETATIVPDRYAKAATITLPASARSLFRFDPRDGAVSSMNTPGESLELDFEGSPFAVLLWTDAETRPLAPIAGGDGRGEGETADRRGIALPDLWQCTYEPTLPTEYADMHDADRDHLRWPHTSAFEWSDGTNTRQVRATFGPRAVRVRDDGSEIPLEYSPSFGIDHDPLHQHTLGPKARVPEEFFDLGKLAAGESATVRFAVRSDKGRDAVLVVSANAFKQAKVNGVPLDFSNRAYRTFSKCQLQAGVNVITLTFIADRGGNVRASYCFIQPDATDALRVPDRIMPADTPQIGTTIRYVKRFACASPVKTFELKVSTAAVASASLDGKPVARIGGFDPYRLQPRGMVYTLSLDAGEHEIAVDVLDTGSAVPILIDARGIASDGTIVTLISDGTWHTSRAGGELAPVAVQLKQDVDGSAWLLFRRPHPLPESRWLEDRANQSLVLDLPASPICDAPVRQTFTWTIPPGARSLRLPLVDATIESLLVDGRMFERTGFEMNLGNEPSGARRAELIVLSRHLGGAVWHDAVSYTFGEGLIAVGDGSRQGLEAYSGAIRLRQTATLDAVDTGPYLLDLGHVRGSVEASVNRQSAGVRVIAPFRFDVTERLHQGENAIELVLVNTLANHLAHWSPTRCIAGDQSAFGIFGPVLLHGLYRTSAGAGSSRDA